MNYKTSFSLALVALLLSGAAQASSINIWPLKIPLWPEQTSDSIRLTNDGEEPVNVQISAKTWDMDESGQFIETDTGDFVFFPRLITLPPHEEKQVRVGYQGEFPALEKSYRVYIEELPPVLSPEEQEKSVGVSYKLKLSLPLFVMPGKTPPPPEIAIDGVEKGERKFMAQPIKIEEKRQEKTEPVLKVGIRAKGAYHLSLSKLEVELFDRAGQSLAKGEANPRLLRILPQRRIFVDISMDTGMCAKAASLSAKVYAEGLKQPYAQTIPLTGGNCQVAK